MAEDQEDREVIGIVTDNYPDGSIKIAVDDRYLTGSPLMAVGKQLVLITEDGARVHVTVSEYAGVDGEFVVRLNPLRFHGNVQMVVKPAVSHA
jgi:hypothetical protein